VPQRVMFPVTLCLHAAFISLGYVLVVDRKFLGRKYENRNTKVAT